MNKRTNIVMDDWNLDENSLDKWQKIYNPPKSLQGITNNIGLTFSVGDTIPQFTTSIEQGN